MATFRQLPAVMNLAFKSGDEVSTSIDFDTSLSGYTVTASVYSLVDRRRIYDIPVAISNATSGIVTMSLTSGHTSGSAPGSYFWSMRWRRPGFATGEPYRTVLSGVVEVVR